MLAELRGRSQITIPSEITKTLGVKEGDKFEVIVKDGGIFLCPVVVYPKRTIEQLAEYVKQAVEETKDNKSYCDVEEMFRDMGIDIDDV